jgi:hypothetical protein
MFKHLMDFSHKRSWQEAIGFYLAFFLLGVILGALSGALLGSSLGSSTFHQGISSGIGIGIWSSIVYSLAVSCTLLIQRKLYKNFGYVLLALLSGLLAAVGGAILGMIIPAFMTTRGSTFAEVEPA